MIRVRTIQRFRSVTDMAKPRDSVVEIDGLTRVINMMGRGAEEVTPALMESLYKEGQNILREARTQVPFKDGVLSSSGRVHTPYVVGNTTSVEITFGGAAGGAAGGCCPRCSLCSDDPCPDPVSLVCEHSSPF